MVRRSYRNFSSDEAYFYSVKSRVIIIINNNVMSYLRERIYSYSRYSLILCVVAYKSRYRNEAGFKREAKREREKKNQI